jgi:hypothetical protein
MTMTYAVEPATLKNAVLGAIELEDTTDGFSPRRLPTWTRAQQADRAIEWMSGQTSGVRLRLLTAAEALTLDCTFTRNMSTDLARPQFPVSLVAEVDGTPVDRVDLDEGPVIVQHPDGGFHEIAGERSTVALALGGDGKTPRQVTIWLPQAAQTVIHEAHATAPVMSAPAPTAPRWLHHGSSISHGMDAGGPLGPWPQAAARSLGLSVTNLGFGGQAVLDPFVARTIAAQPADVITLKLGINIVNGDTMRERTLVPAMHGFLDIIRETHPTTPLAVITPISCPELEDTPGPSRLSRPGYMVGTPRPMTVGDGTLTLGATRRAIRRVVDNRMGTDRNLYLLDGRELLGENDASHLYDGVHPDQAGYSLMATRFAELVNTPGTPLYRAFTDGVGRGRR